MRLAWRVQLKTQVKTNAGGGLQRVRNEGRGTPQDNERASGRAGSWRTTLLKSYRVEKTPGGKTVVAEAVNVLGPLPTISLMCSRQAWEGRRTERNSTRNSNAQMHLTARG
jgi:hypothetical protein